MSLKVVLGWLATIGWVAVWGYFLHTEWPRASSMSFNEWGDFFAGASAPLAFLWLVIGYFQQGEELSQNTEALKQQERALSLQVKELKQSVEQQQEMVKVTQQELEINKANIDRQYQKEKLLSQPLIRAKGVDGTEGNGVRTQSVKAINIGHMIKTVNLELLDPPEGLELLNKFIPHWDYNSVNKLNFRHSSGQKYTGSDNFEVKLTFIDGLGEPSSETLYFSFNTAGTLIFSSEQNTA